MKKLLLHVFLFFWCFNLSAQEIDSLIPQEPPMELDITQSQTIITAEEIFERGYDNLDELLSSVPGVFITHDRTLTQIGMRAPSATASNNQRIQVLLDGFPLNSLFSGQAPSGYDLGGINMEDIEEVIILRNASPIENGNNAMLGVIKINTKKPKKGLRLNFDTGSYGELDGGFSFGQTIGKANIGFSGRLADIKGQELFFPGDDILTKEASEYGGTRLRFNLGKFSFNASYHRRNEAIAAVPNNPFALEIDSMFFIDSTQNIFKEELDMDGNLKENVFYFDANFSTSIGQKQFMDIRLFLNYKNNTREQSFRDTEIFIDTLFLDTVGFIEYYERPQQRTLWTGLDYRHRFRLLPNNELSFGTSVMLLPISKFESKNELFKHFDGFDTYTENFEQDILDYVDFKGENFNKNFSYWSVAFFAEDKLKLSNLLTLNVGGRVEISSQAKPVFAPQFALQFSPFENRTNFHFGYSRGYRLPTIQETDVIITDNLATAPNPTPDEDLVPETVNNFELGLRQKIGKDLDLNLAFYHQELNDLIWNETTMINRQNDEIIRATGLEGGLGVSLPKGVRSYFNYNFQFDKKEKINMPSPLCKFGVTIPFLRHFTLFAEGQYEGERLTFDGTYTLPYFLMNTNLLIRPKVAEGSWLEGLSVAFRVYNLLDEFYQHPSGQQFTPNLIPQNGRTWQTQLTYQF